MKVLYKLYIDISIVLVKRILKFENDHLSISISLYLYGHFPFCLVSIEVKANQS